MDQKLPHLDVGSGRQIGAITLFPVWVDAPAVRGIDWKTEGLDIAEIVSGAEVNALEIENRSSRLGVIIEGDLLVGGRQHRMAVASRVFTPHERARVEVACVEHGRWDGGAAHLATGRRASSVIRQGSLAHRGRDFQGEVWRRIGSYDARFTPSPTSSMLDHLTSAHARPDDLVRLMSGQRGVIVGIGGRIIGAEIYGNSRGLATRWKGLLDAARLDARGAPPIPTEAQQARDFVRAIGSAPLEFGESPEPPGR